MIATDQHIVDAVVLTEGCMKKAFARSCITHIKRITGVDDVFFDKVFIDKDINRFNANIGWNVTCFQVADQRVDQNAVTYLNCDFCQVLMRTMHRITELQCSNVCPTTLVEHLAGLGRFQIDTRILFLIFAFGENLDGAGDVDIFLGKNHDHAWMIFLCNLPELVTN